MVINISVQYNGGVLPDILPDLIPCSADHERDWPPQVVFFGLATNALNVRNMLRRSRCIQIFL